MAQEIVALGQAGYNRVMKAVLKSEGKNTSVVSVPPPALFLPSTYPRIIGKLASALQYQKKAKVFLWYPDPTVVPDESNTSQAISWVQDADESYVWAIANPGFVPSGMQIRSGDWVTCSRWGTWWQVDACENCVESIGGGS